MITLCSFMFLLFLWVAGFTFEPFLLYLAGPYTLTGLLCAIWMYDVVKAIATFEYRNRLWGASSDRDFKIVAETITDDRLRLSAYFLFYPILSLCGFLESFMLESG